MMIYKEEFQNGRITGEINLIFRARMLWRNLATWITIYLVSTYGGYPNQQAVSEKLYAVPLEYGNFMRLVFGNPATEDYINILSMYIITLQNLFHAQMRGDAEAVDTYARQLYQNIDQRAEFLAALNPYWQKEVWQGLLYYYNNLLLENSMTLLLNDFVKNTEVFDRLLSYSSVIGDYFSEGIIQYLGLPGALPSQVQPAPEQPAPAQPAPEQPAPAP